MRVAVLAGGRSSEHEISLASGSSVREALAEAGHEVLFVQIGRDGRWARDGGPVTLEPGAGLLGADVVFPALHGPFGEDGTVQGLLEVLDVPYVGAGVMASAVAMDKLVFKDLMGRAGVPQVEYAAARDGEDPTAVERLGLPVFVKPARLGSSVGISKVESKAELRAALGAAFEHDPVAVVEAMARGVEVECSVLGNSDPEASEPGQIVPHAEWYDYEAKYTPGGMELVVPAPVPAAVRERVRELAVEVFRRVECAGMARVDFFVEDPGGQARVLVNELNTIPGFTATSVFAKLFEASGVGYVELLERLLRLALERHDRERRYLF
ncbi:MAG TPA: D-alanine--D-alanine ligase family protein [Thermoleophilaceae bacterium]|nr:D-alanine--D-alanine ligase family protein [Thermoleophilaceae bacterium]